jgi:hypothetical protein
MQAWLASYHSPDTTYVINLVSFPTPMIVALRHICISLLSGGLVRTVPHRGPSIPKQRKFSIVHDCFWRCSENYTNRDY